MLFPFQVDNSLNFLTQFIQSYTNVAIIMKDSIGSSRVNYIYIALSQNRFVLLDLPIAMNLFKCEKTLCFCIRIKKHLITAFIKINNS